MARYIYEFFSNYLIVFNGDINGSNISEIMKGTDLKRIYIIKGDLYDCDINAFPNLCLVTGNIRPLKNTPSIKGLSNLTSVGENLNFRNCIDLMSLEGLANLTTVGAFLNFYNCTNLVSLEGLTNLTSVGGYLNFRNCSNIVSLKGMSNLTYVGEFLSFRNCKLITSLECLIKLTSIGSDLYLNGSNITDDHFNDLFVKGAVQRD